MFRTLYVALRRLLGPLPRLSLSLLETTELPSKQETVAYHGDNNLDDHRR